MEQCVKTYHNYTDDEVNASIEGMNRDGWEVSRFEIAAEVLEEKIHACLVILYERHK
jgi:hypothetical protein